jgi:hypothetical protein
MVYGVAARPGNTISTSAVLQRHLRRLQQVQLRKNVLTRMQQRQTWSAASVEVQDVHSLCASALQSQGHGAEDAQALAEVLFQI